MPEQISYARSGEPIFSIDGTYLHSRYDPRTEAERYIESLPLGDHHRVFVVIEPGFGYLCAAIKKKIPRARVLAAHCTAFFKSVDLPGCGADAEWFPGDAIAFNAFLELNIHDCEATFVKVIDWKPSIRLFGDMALSLISDAAVFLKRSSANARTVARFGPKWVRNAFRFASRVNSELRIRTGSSPIAVTASGPSLEGCIPTLRRAQGDGLVYIVAVSSSVQALLAGGVRPDLIVATDGGGWASFHLHDALRARIPLAIALTAALPSSAYDSPIIPIRDLSKWQSIVAGASNIPTFAAPQRGTVAATAIDLALDLSTGPIYLAGYDLGVREGRTHARPNALDRFYEDTASRLMPSASGSYERFLTAQSGQALRVYEDWMSENIRRIAVRVRILGKGSKTFDWLPHAVGIEAAQDVTQGARFFPSLDAHRLPEREAQTDQFRTFDILSYFLDKELDGIAENGFGRKGVLFEKTLSAELSELLLQQDFSRAATECRAGTLSRQHLQALNEKTKEALRACITGAPNNG